MRPVPIESLETPAVYIRLDILKRNIAAMAALARAAGVKLRPHVKTHKCKEILAMQREAGAAGITVAKPTEAQALGCGTGDDVFVAYPGVGPRMDRVVELMEAGVAITTVVDSELALWELSSRISASGEQVKALIEIEVGHRRLGLVPDDPQIPKIVALARDLPGVQIAGVCAHGGHAYAADGPAGAARAGEEEGRLAVQAAAVLQKEGVADPIVSVGSTPTAATVARVKGVTEIRPGTYVFHDATQVRLGAATAADCALRVLCRVVGRPGPGRAVLDGGSKTFTSDRLPPPGSAAGAGLVYREVHGDVVRDDLRLVRMSEEHGILEGPGADALKVGDHVAVAPAHACGTVNLHDQLWVADGGKAVDRWAVVARGRIW